MICAAIACCGGLIETYRAEHPVKLMFSVAALPRDGFSVIEKQTHKEIKAEARRRAEEAKRREEEERRKRLASLIGGYSETTQNYMLYAQSLFADYGWSDDELEPLINLWNRESHWNPNAHNSSGAHGIPQSLPGSKMASEGADWATNGNTQIRWGLGYIAGRYGSPSAAWSFFQSHNSY